MKKKQTLLLLEDVHGLGRKGEVVQAKPGYFRNFLLPQQMALRAGPQTLRMQDRLQKEREEKARVDRQESEKIKEQLVSITLQTKVKTDPHGKMYGSLTVLEILSLLEQQGIVLEKQAVRITKPIKTLGTHRIPLALKEEVITSVKVILDPEDEEVKLALARQAEEKAALASESPQEEPSV
ncbi:MAG: 50S ribosomal protein L9 [Chlamydiota bacterium]